MASPAILIASIFLLVAFAVERFSRIQGLPSVIVLVVVGIVAKPLLHVQGYTLNSMDAVVPILGTVGLVLIVLEGALDIELRRDRIRAAASAMLLAVGGFVLCVVAFTFAAVAMLELKPIQGMLLAVPFAVISSAVAIPSSEFLPKNGREFVVYESSVSDILGVLVFYSLVNSKGTFGSVLAGLAGGGMLSLLLSIVSAIALVLVLVRIDGHIRFIPLLAGLFGLYAAGKLLHLSPLIMVLLFGLALNNPQLIQRIKPFSDWIDDSYEETLSAFKVLVLELTFAVRGFFFLLLGYDTNLSDLASTEAWIAAGFVLGVVYFTRYLMLRAVSHGRARVLTWIAPRGLITVLLFLSVQDGLPLPAYLNGTVVIVVLVSAALITVARFRTQPEEGLATLLGGGPKPADKG